VADTKQDVLDMLRELAELVALDEGDPQSFRVRAYESASYGVEGFAGDLKRLPAKEIERIPGVGKSTAAKIRELVDTGKVQKLEELRAKHPPAVVALLRIPGLGPKALRRLREELEVAGLDDLKRVLAEHRLRDLRGFGARSEEKLAAAVARLEAQGAVSRTPISVALPLAERVVAELSRVPGATHASYCGSLRRFCGALRGRRRSPGDSVARARIDLLAGASGVRCRRPYARRPEPAADATGTGRLVEPAMKGEPRGKGRPRRGRALCSSARTCTET
jgi:DNA polymerase (family 10)